MSLRDRMFELTEVEHVDEFLKQYPTGAFFKAGACHKTMQGFGVIEEALNKRDNLFLGFVRVIESRPVSNYIAQITDVVHQSPQFILLVDGKVVFDVDNWDITPDVVEDALHQQFGPAQGEAGSVFEADVTLYLELLQRYLSDDLSENEFEESWLMAFQSDATPRSTKQFTLLNSLYGDVDAAIAAGPFAALGRESLRDRAEHLYKQLTAE